MNQTRPHFDHIDIASDVFCCLTKNIKAIIRYFVDSKFLSFRYLIFMLVLPFKSIYKYLIMLKLKIIPKENLPQSLVFYLKV